jgi:hypothetical protein
MSNTGGQHWGFYWRLPSLLLLRLHMPKSVLLTMNFYITIFNLDRKRIITCLIAPLFTCLISPLFTSLTSKLGLALPLQPVILQNRIIIYMHVPIQQICRTCRQKKSLGQTSPKKFYSQNLSLLQLCGCTYTFSNE